MARTATAAPRLTDQQLAELLDLTRDVDSVELKLTVPEVTQRSTVRALQLDPLEAQIRQVFFFDTPDLALNQKGSSPARGVSRGRAATLSSSSAPSSRTSCPMICAGLRASA